MHTKDFNELVETLSRQVIETLQRKQDEYNLTADRLEFFKKGAVLSNNEPHQTLLGYTNKQIVSEFEMGYANQNFTEARWREKNN